MKNVSLALLLATSAMTVQAQDSAIAQPVANHARVFRFTNGETHDFGTLKEGAVAVYEFRFKNVGKDTLTIDKVKASCSCTVPEWPKAPIPPGKTGKLKVSFNTEGKSGAFSKTVFIYYNGKGEKDTYNIYIKGMVTPKAGSAVSSVKE